MRLSPLGELKEEVNIGIVGTRMGDVWSRICNPSMEFTLGTTWRIIIYVDSRKSL